LALVIASLWLSLLALRLVASTWATDNTISQVDSRQKLTLDKLIIVSVKTVRTFASKVAAQKFTPNCL
jgi:hypothetical protein